MHRPYGDSASYANEVIECLFPIDGSGRISVLRCGVDASTRNGGIFTVAAVTYGLDSAKKANQQWPYAALDGRTFHMTDLNARQGEFKGITDDQVAEIMKGAVAAVRNHAFSVVAVSCDASEVSEHLPCLAARDTPSQEILAAMRSPYGAMCHLCMTVVGQMCPGKRDVAYTLESGDDGQRGVLRYLDFIENDSDPELLRDLYSFRRKSVGTKEDIEGIFHAADLVAWECGKRAEQFLAGKTRKRKSFELLSTSQNPYFAYFPPANMAHFLKTYQRMLSVEKRPEMIEKILREWRAPRETEEGRATLYPVPL